ncbi:AAA family ATPase [Candidatus Saccharibacteria bacterium]|nr:AAA family ATPase [Candidatus Saccharibacteria bacterium]
MSGSGKSVAVDYLTNKGYPKVYFGGMILKALEKSGLEINEQNEKNFREQIRKTEGKDWVVRQVIDEVHDLMKAGQKRIVLDGVYSWTEYTILKKEFPKMLTFVAVVVPKKLRYKRVGQRQVRPLTPEEVRSRDIGEIENMEKGGPIAAADYYILNDGTVEQMQEKMGDILKEINF